MGGACSTHGRDDKLIQNSSQKSWREELPRRWRHRCANNNEDLKEIECEGVEWFRLAHSPVVVSCERDSQPSAYIKGMKFLDRLSYCHLIEKTTLHWVCFTPVWVPELYSSWRTPGPAPTLPRSRHLNGSESKLALFTFSSWK